jgi:hypothetical protein
MFAVVCAALAVYFRYAENGHWYWFLIASGLFLVMGYLAIPLLRPLYLIWMKFAFMLGWINTRILLGLFFFLVLTPMGIVLRVMGKDLLDARIDKSATTYWSKREKALFDRERYKRLF